MTKFSTKPTLWNRTTQALGKLLAGMVSSHGDKRPGAADVYPRFPMF